MAFDKWLAENKEAIQKAVRSAIEQDYYAWLRKQPWCTDELLTTPMDKKLESLRTQEIRSELRKIEENARQMVK